MKTAIAKLASFCQTDSLQSEIRSVSIEVGERIDEDAARPDSVTGGLYRFCRNPIFLALLVVIAGYTLMLPTVLSRMPT